MRLTGRAPLRSLKRHLSHIKPGTPVVIGLTDLAAHQDDILAAGFSSTQAPGERLLPARVGSVSAFNAEGRWKVHRDQPMETAYREFNWEWKQWDGTWHSDTVYQPYQRYPRTKIEPPAVELEIEKDPMGAKVVVTEPLMLTKANEARLLHQINLFRELFGEATVLTEDLEQFTRVKVKRLNWELLPPGKMPWPELQKRVGPLIERMGERKAPVAERRLKLLTEVHHPDFVAVGHAGFSGYLIFGFAGTNVLESLQYGNATYVFGEDWEDLSKLTKAEILHGDLQQDRIIHRENWEAQIHELLS